jgi:hypothetical protein
MNTIVLPTQYALSDFGLSRFVKKTDKNNNPFIKYSNEKIDGNQEEMDKYLNEVFLEVFENQPIKIKTEPDAGGVMRAKMQFGGSTSNPNILAKYRILIPSQQVPIAHNHYWNKGSSFLGDVYNAINNLQDIGAVASTVAANAAAMASDNTNFRSPVAHKTDFEQTYERSDHPSLQLEFNLFTNSNFIRDIYHPLMELVSFTYPKRISPSDDAKTSNGGNIVDSAIESTMGKLNTVDRAVQQVKEYISLTARQYALRPPCLFNIYHQAGLYTYSNCFCKSMNILYDGPWYNATSSEEVNFNIDIAPKSTTQTRTLPSTAKVTMVFQSQELMFRDDFTLISSRFREILRNGSVTSFNQFIK